MICGIDPGLKGGIAFLDNELRHVQPLPIIGKQVDVGELDALLALYDPKKVYIELQTIMQRQGGALTIGANYGRLLAVLELHQWPHEIVTPRGWMQRAGIPAKLTGKQRHEAAFLAAKKIWGVQLGNLKPSNDGQIAAILIALFGEKNGS